MGDRSKATSPGRRRRERDPLQLRLSVSVRFGDAPDEKVVLMDDRDIQMVGSVFRYRDKMARFMVTGLLRAAMLQPKLAARILPGLKALQDKSS